MIYVALLNLSFIALVRADEPKPPWQRLLTGDDAKKAAELNKRIKQLETADKYDEVIRLQEELLALRTKVQGADHWQTMNENWALIVYKKVSVLPEVKRTGWGKASRGAIEARRLNRKAQYASGKIDSDNGGIEVTRRLNRKAQYASALPLLQERLTWSQQVLGQDHPDTAIWYSEVAFNLNAQGKYAEAGPLFQTALDVTRKVLGENHPYTAASYNNIAYNLSAQGKYSEAEPLLQKALEIRRKSLGYEHPDTALSYKSIAANLNNQGKYAEAQQLLQKAQRLLDGDDAKKAAELRKQVTELEAADKYAEAINLLEKLLELRTKVQGADHWQTVNVKWVLNVYKKVAVLPEEKRTGWRKAARDDREAHQLNLKGLYAVALPLHQEYLRWCRNLLGEDHPYTAASYNSVAFNLNAQGKYAEAGPLFQKALDTRIKALGQDHPTVAMSYNNIAFNLNAQGKYAEAAPLYQKALDIIHRKVMGEDPDTAQIYDNVARNLNAQGKYAEAGPVFLKALHIRRKVLGDDDKETATSYNSVAFNLNAQGKYAEAGPLFQKALDINRNVLGEDYRDTATSYNNIAYNLNAQGKYAEADSFYQKALEVYRKVLGEDHPGTANIYDNIGSNLTAQGKYAEAEPLLQKGLDIRRKVLGDDHHVTATSYNSVAFNLNAQGKYAEAGPLFHKALEVNLKVFGENHPSTATCYNNVAFTLNAQGKYAEALESLETGISSFEAARLAVAGAGLERAPFGEKRSPYALLTAARSRAGKLADAWAALEADLGRGLLDEIAARRGSGLTPAEQRQRDDLRTQRASLEARILPLVSRSKRTDAESAELDRLVGERRQMEQALDQLAVAISSRELITLDKLQAALQSDAAFIAWVDVFDDPGGVQEHWGCVVRPKRAPLWERLPGSGADGKWTQADSDLPYQLRQALVHSARASTIDELAKKLHAQRLAPLSKHLAGVQRLYIAPVRWMSGIPIEALTDKYTVSYTPSGTHLARMKEGERPGSAGLLAVGDPMFPPAKETPAPTALPPGGLLITQISPDSTAAKARLQSGDVLVAYAGEDLTSVDQLGKLIEQHGSAKSVIVKLWREGQDKLAERSVGPGPLGVVLAKEPARAAILDHRQTNQMLAKLTRGDEYAELPGTQVEIARLAALFDAKAVTTLTRADAGEERLEALRQANELKRFRYLHFATHGKANNFRSFDSALILTKPHQQPLPRPGAPFLDGRLTAAEVLEYWKLDAELVTLSACESGLGRYGGGDGLLGFAQAFLLAGSRSVCLTLWQVDDTATALLMDRFYRNMLGKREDGAPPMGKAAALREAKQWLRNLPAPEALERLGKLTNGVVRGERPVREEMRPIPQDSKPFAHPHYWAAFILIGDPE